MAKQNSELFSRTQRVYAMSLLELAEKANQAREIEEEMRAIADLAEQNPKVLELLANKRVRLQRRSEALSNIFKGRVSDLSFKFLHILTQRNRIDELPGIITAFIALAQSRYGVVEVDAFVAEPMSDELTARLGDTIEKAITRKPLIRQHTDKTLIGGIKLRVGDYLVDGSVATQLRLMREKLIDQSRAHARNDADRIFKN